MEPANPEVNPEQEEKLILVKVLVKGSPDDESNATILKVDVSLKIKEQLENPIFSSLFEGVK